MKSTDIQMHDCITIIKKHKDPAKSYYGSTEHVLVTGVGETSFSYITASGDAGDRVFTKIDDTDEYTFSIEKLSEVLFEKEIEGFVKSRKESVKSALESLVDVLKFQKKFRDDISLLGRLKRVFIEAK